VIAASVVILTAGYILWAVQRVYLGAEYKGPHPEAITPITDREVFIGAALLLFCIVLGVYPNWMFSQMRESVNLLVDNISATKGLSEFVKQLQNVKQISGL
ncbi:MAG: hypothetical protein HY290_07990, partial [Planctomycetia bacterium]|nr:hypothetical protein [Planctomycetia bacterium]